VTGVAGIVLAMRLAGDVGDIRTMLEDGLRDAVEHPRLVTRGDQEPKDLSVGHAQKITVKTRGRAPFESVLRREGLHMMSLDLGFRRFVIGKWPVEAHSLGSPGLVDVGAQYIPALAEVQHPMMALSHPALGGDSDPVFVGLLLGHFGALRFEIPAT